MKKDNNSKISFVIPAYNSESTITETIDSIFDDNFIDGDEVIIVEDKSTDNTLKVALELQNKFSPNIKIMRNENNMGCPASRNVGIKASNNNYIFSFDADNILEKNSVNRLRKIITEQEFDVVTFGGVKFFTENKNKITHSWIFKKGLFSLSDLFSGNRSPAPLGNYLFTKESWLRIDGFSELEKGLDEAWIFTFKQLLSGSKIYIDNQGYYYHRYGYDSLTIREYKKKDNIQEKILRKALEGNMHIFNKSESDYIEDNTPLWIHELNKRPIKLKGEKIGKNGKLKITPYGIRQSIKKIFIRLRVKKQQILEDLFFRPKAYAVFLNPYFINRNGLFKEIKRFANNTEPNQRVLDVGCGLKPYKHLFKTDEYIGIDIETGGHSNQDKYVDKFYDGENIPYEDNSFDLLICTQVLEHAENPEKVLSECNRVLKGGGKAFFSMPFMYPEHEIPYDFQRYTQFKHAKNLKENGFHNNSIKKQRGFLVPLVKYL